MTKSAPTRRVKKSEFGKAPRLYARATFLGFRRGKTGQTENHALVNVEHLNSSNDAQFYFGKRIVYIYKSKSGFRTIWGRIMKAHGGNGVLRATFNHNLPPRAIGASLRVMLYPNRA